MKKADNHILVIFGASGDLTWRKLIPSVYELQQQNMLPDGFAILGIGRSALSDESFREKNETRNQLICTQREYRHKCCTSVYFKTLLHSIRHCQIHK